MDSTKRSNRSCKRKLAISSDSEEDIKTAETDDKTQRRSSRIHDKQHRTQFRLPSRDEIWKDIPSTKSTPKLKSLTPRKTVNDFTKVYNTYNYDDYEDTSDDDSSSVETSDSENQQEVQHRIKNYHKRLQKLSSSSDEDEGKLGGSDRESVQTSTDVLGQQDRKGTAKETQETGNENSSDNKQSRLDSDQAVPSENADREDSDENEILTPCRKHANLRNRSVLESDDESTKNGNDNDDGCGNGDSQNDNENTSESSDSSDHPLESRRSVLAKQKIKQLSVFQKLRDAQAKRKKSFSDT